MAKPEIAITIGDCAGIGPEIIFKAVNSYDIKRIARVCSLTIFGDKSVISKYADINRRDISFCFTSDYNRNITLGKPSKLSGLIAADAIYASVKSAMSGKVKAVVTAPVSKESFKLAGLKFHAHTELLAHITKTKKYSMMMFCNDIKSVMVTRHLPVSSVSANLTKKEIIDTVKVSANFIKNIIKKEPQIIITGLNPHCGDNGIIGTEELKTIIPSIKKLKSLGFNVTGPLPSDKAWLDARDKKCDLIVAMYHDQVMLPLKLIDDKKIVNVTAGLPIIRTSPGHGTAFDIAGTNKADATSMCEAIKCAVKLAGIRI